MKRITIVVTLLILVVCGLVGIIIYNELRIPKKYTGPPLHVSIGTAPFTESGLIYIAEKQGSFAENGLDVTIELFEAGRFAVNALLEGKVDIATAAEFVFVGNAMNQDKIQTIGSIAKTDFQYLIARKDRGIERVTDLKGKKIGLTRRTSAEVCFGRYLQLHGINITDVTIVDLNPAEQAKSLAEGDVDVVLAWEPYAYSVEKALGPNAIVWPAQSGQMVYWLLICGRDFISGHPELIDRFLRSLDQAEQFLVNNPDKAKNIVKNRLAVEDAYIDRVWPKTSLGLSLNQGLIIAMEDESRWVIDNNLINNPKMPYYPDYIHWQGLEKVKPESVTVIH